MPKEMLPLVDKPIIQYIVEELVGAGIKDIVIITGYHKRSIEDHFDHMSMDLRTNLQQGGKTQLLKETKKISELANFVYVRQKGPYGNATPVMNAAHLIGDEPFIYTYADDFIHAKPTRFQQMVKLYKELNGSIVPCVKIGQPEEYDRYGIVAGDTVRKGVLKMSTIIEKPGQKNAPSGLASVSGYLFTPKILKYFESCRKKLEKGKEFYIQSVMQEAIDNGEPLYACEIAGGKFNDTGDKLEYVKTVIDFALEREDIGAELKTYLKQKML